MTADPSPPTGFAIRAARLDDAAAVAAMQNANALAEVGAEAFTTPAEILDAWGQPGRDLAVHDAVATWADGGGVAGTMQLHHFEDGAEVVNLVYVHPDAWGRGLGRHLLDLGEARIRRHVLPRVSPGRRCAVQVARWVENEDARELFAAAGYAFARRFDEMMIDLADEPPAAEPPPGVSLEPFDPDRDAAAIHEAIQEAFADHWGHTAESFERWRHRNMGSEGFGYDPALWVVAREGDAIAGALVAHPRTPDDPEGGFVAQLGVRRPWRRRGIALAMLSATFAEYRRRGTPRAHLVVDSASPTGAADLYRLAGMRAHRSWELWEKELRPAAG